MKLGLDWLEIILLCFLLASLGLRFVTGFAAKRATVAIDFSAVLLLSIVCLGRLVRYVRKPRDNLDFPHTLETTRPSKCPSNGRMLRWDLPVIEDERPPLNHTARNKIATINRSLSHEDYTVGWICALPIEMAAAKAMLDEIHADLPTSPYDDNTYILGRMCSHNVVVACLPTGVVGAAPAAAIAIQMLSSFRSIRFGLMVGIGGGSPSLADIRLGDVVVGKPTTAFGGVVQYDYGKTIRDGVFERTGTLNKPPRVLLTALSKLQANHLIHGSQIPRLLSEIMNPTFMPQDQDRLFHPEYHHTSSGVTCDECDQHRLMARTPRGKHSPKIHYGVIASGNWVLKDGCTRDRLAREYNILCFEMEAAGLMDNFPCLVIRGISDYADSHKNKAWQGYAAATAAAYTKELLSVVPTKQVEDTTTVSHLNSIS